MQPKPGALLLSLQNIQCLEAVQHDGLVEGSCVDHGGVQVGVPEQVLDGGHPAAHLQQLGRIEWKGGALHPCGCTFPPSPLRTGQAIFTASGSPT